MDQVDDIDELYRTVLEDLEEIWRQQIEEEKAVYDAWERVKTRILLESDPVELDGDVDVPGPCEEEVQHPEPPQLAPALELAPLPAAPLEPEPVSVPEQNHEAEQQQEQEKKDGEATTELTPEKLRWQAKKILDTLVVSTKGGFEITQEQMQQIAEHLSAANRVFGQQKIKRPNKKKRLRERKKALVQNAETNSTASGSGTALAPSNQNQNQSNHSQNPNESHQLVSLPPHPAVNTAIPSAPSQLGLQSVIPGQKNSFLPPGHELPNNLKILIWSREVALTYALEYGHRSQPDQDAERQEQRVFWVDGSRTPHNAGSGVVYRDDGESNRWSALGIHLHQCEMLMKCSLPVDSLDAELCAISAALDVAMMSSTYQKQIVIFSDSQTALKTIRDGRHRDMSPGSLAREYATRMLARVRVLEQLGVPVLLRWVPAHAQVLGNVMADAIAKYAAQFGARDVVNPCGITTLTADLFIEDMWIMIPHCNGTHTRILPINPEG